MPVFFEIKDRVTGKILRRHGLDAREIVGSDPGRFSFVGDAVGLKPIVHGRQDERDAEPSGLLRISDRDA